MLFIGIGISCKFMLQKISPKVDSNYSLVLEMIPEVLLEFHLHLSAHTFIRIFHMTQDNNNNTYLHNTFPHPYDMIDNPHFPEIDYPGSEKKFDFPKRKEYP